MFSSIEQVGKKIIYGARKLFNIILNIKHQEKIYPKSSCYVWVLFSREYDSNFHDLEDFTGHTNSSLCA